MDNTQNAPIVWTLKQEIDDLNEVIRQSKLRISELRKECKHTNDSIQQVETSPDHRAFCKVCDVCGEIVGYPSPQELTDSH